MRTVHDLCGFIAPIGSGRMGFLWEATDQRLNPEGRGQADLAF